MRSGKRMLAGAAAGALAAGLIPFALVATATSANAATATASVTPVRSGAIGTIPAATAAWQGTGLLTGATIDLVTAPTVAAVLNVDDSAVLLGADGVLTAPATVVGDDTTVSFRADVAGTYSGTIADGTDTVSFSFTTRGAPASMTLTPASQTILVGAEAELEVKLLDSNGNVTQPATVDTVALSDNSDDTVAPALLNAAALATGMAEVTLDTAGNAAGTTTITATPQGTLPGGGVTTQTATVTKSGTVNSVPAVSIKVTAPANASSVPANTDNAVSRAVAVPLGTSSLTVQVDDTTGNAVGSTIRLKVTPSAGTINGVSGAQFIEVTTDANRQATTTLALGGAATQSGAFVTIEQVNVTNVTIAGNVVVTQTQPGVTSATISVSPDDSAVAQLGATTDVMVTVDDSFGNPMVGWTVSAVRGAMAPGTFLSSGVTNADGEAAVTVTSAAGAVNGTVESYSFRVTPPVGPIVDKNDALQITYTTSGEIDTLSVVAAPVTVPSPVTNATASVTTAPFINVVSSGVADTGSTGTFTVATGVQVVAPDGNRATFTPTTTPLNNVTVTVPEGVKVSTTLSTVWSGGSQSVTVSSGTPVYVFATATGTFDVTFSSGGKTAVVPVKVGNTAADAYNIAIDPESQDVGTGAIGTVTLMVSDIFGNPVATTPTTGEVTITASGEILLAGFMPTNSFTTNASGMATVTFIAGNSGGVGDLVAGPSTGDLATAWQAGFTPPAGAPAPITSAAAEVTVASGPEFQAIFILDGARNGQRIETFGESLGFEMGAILKPWIRFPGQTGFSMGTANILVDDMGDWNWGRNTGKRTAVQIRDLDNMIRSNTVIIEARNP